MKRELTFDDLGRFQKLMVYKTPMMENLREVETELDEGWKDVAGGLLMTLAGLFPNWSQAQAQQAQQKIASLQTPEQVMQFKDSLLATLPSDVDRNEVAEFSQTMDRLASKIGTKQKGGSDAATTVTKYTGVNVYERVYTYNATNPTQRQTVANYIAYLKSKPGEAIVAIDTISKQVPPTEVKTQMVDSIKIPSQLMGYDTVNVDDQLIGQLVQKLTEQFQNAQAVTGYITVYGSASHVPTHAFPSNEALAQARACKIAQVVQSKLPDNLKGVQVNIEFGVNGPTFENDEQNKEKYYPFQYATVTVHVEGVNTVQEPAQMQQIVIKSLVASADTDQKTNIKGGLPTPFGQIQPKGKASTSCPVFK